MTHEPPTRHDPDAAFAAARADAQPSTGAEPSFPSRNTGDVERARAFAIEAARMCRDDKCSDVVLLDVRELSQITDFLVIASGTSDRQMRSVLHHIEELGKDQSFPAARSSADDRGTWLLADFVDVVVHLFEPNTRAHYDLEMLWGDAPRLEWQREGGARPGLPRSAPGDDARPASRDYAGLHSTTPTPPPTPDPGEP
ncbi:MAG: ribosome silencing factor [Phycisphaerales bacterium]|jgi:ribosome-associated protein|nr:ribosome silencing factor [Phycisphaerales bacterium]